MNKENENLLYSYVYSNRLLIYITVLYVGGMLLGTAIFKIFGTFVSDSIMNKITEVSADSFVGIFFNKLCVYLTVYAVTVIFGLCVLGYPVVFTVPLLTGVIIALKLSYYYFTYKLKGIGFSILMITPESAAFETVLFYTINNSAKLSKSLFLETVNKKDMISSNEFDFKSYLKKFLLYFLIITSIAAINALMTFLLNSVVKL